MDQKTLLNTLYQLSQDNPRNSTIQNLFLNQAMSYLNPQSVLQSLLGGGAANTSTTVPTGQHEATPTYSDLLGGTTDTTDTGVDIPDELYNQYQSSLGNTATGGTPVQQTTGFEKFVQNLPGVSDIETLFGGLGAEATNPGTGALQYLLTNRPQNILGGISYGLNKLFNPNQLAQMEAQPQYKLKPINTGYMNLNPAGILTGNPLNKSYY